MTDTLTAGEDMDLTAPPLPFAKQPIAPAPAPRREETLDEFCSTKRPCACGSEDSSFSTEYGNFVWNCLPCRQAKRDRMSR